MPKLAVTTLGCKLNFAETATIAKQFEDKGYEVVPFGKKADISIINSCTVTAQAERKSVYAAKKASKKNPYGITIVTGCAAQINPNRFLKIPEIDFVIGTKDKFNIIEIIENTKNRKIQKSIFEANNFNHSFSISKRTRSFLKIQDGCDYKCSYCIIPKARGKSRSPLIEEILNDVDKIIAKGFKEIVLTGVNIGDFGKNNNENFFELLKELEKIKKIERYRISSIEPDLLSSKIIDLVADSQKIMPHFHLPLQSGSDKILKIMKRRYNKKLFAEKITELHKKLPDAFFGIDVIVGFPGEDEKHFKETYNLLKTLPVSYLHIFPYSDRKGTVSEKLKTKVPSEWIKLRELELKKLSNTKEKKFYEKYKNSTQKILFEAKSKSGKIFGYSENYLRVGVNYNQNLINQIKHVKLKKIQGNYFIGELLD